MPGALMAMRRGVLAKPTTSWVPTDLGGSLWGWYKADSEAYADAAAAEAHDLSGLGHDLLNGTSGNRPVLKESIIDGHDVWRFDGSNDFLQNTSALGALVHRFTVLRHRDTLAPTNAIDCGNTGPFDCLFSRRTSTDVGMYSGSVSPQVATTPQSWHYYGELFNGASSSLSIDGGTPTTGNPGTVIAGGLTLGAAQNGSTPAAIDVAEMIVCSAAITGTNLTNLIAYLDNRYPTI